MLVLIEYHRQAFGTSSIYSKKRDMPFIHVFSLHVDRV
ncbi:hypothetical protein C2W64_04720 [Brevibacillus laterosporus]|nr:hypothetical protein C2W64_04720 [Brevibacillus laterosporus]